MYSFTIVFYETEDGRKPVEEFVRGLDKKMKARVTRYLEILQERGSALREPLSAPLADGLFELRIIQGNNIVRMLYFFHKGKIIIVTNGFVKKTKKTPRTEILRAKKRRNDYLRRKDKR